MKSFKKLVLPLLTSGAILASTLNGFAQSTAEVTGVAPKVFIPLVLSATDSTVEGNETPVAQLIPDQYIVVLKDDLVTAASVNSIAAEMASQYGGELLYTYEDAVRGFAMKLPSTTSAEAVQNLTQDSLVAFVEQDTVVTVTEEEQVNVTQTGATWGLDRIDQRNLPLSGSFTYTKNGSGVRVYIIDTGIRRTHSQFSGRALDGYDAIDGSLPAADCNGHGTQVAGTVGGSTYGVAKNVTLVAVRVLNCSGSGSTSGVIAGINWVKANHVKPAVANMSLGGSASSALDTAVTNAINAGVTFVIAAGNSNANACNYSPARVANAFTVGATTSTDTRASYSNYGSCLDLFAPGSSITSAWYTNDSATATISGTSMATPHVAGVAALYLQGTSNVSPTTVTTALRNNATSGVVKSPGTNSPNRLLFTNY